MKQIVRWFIGAVFLPAMCLGQTFDYFNSDLNSAQLKFILTQETAKEILLEPRCLDAVKKNTGFELSKEDILQIPVFLVDDLFYGEHVKEKPLALREWTDKLGEAANTVCIKYTGGEYGGFINIPLDTLFTSDYPFMVFVHVHETLHYFQCLSGRALRVPEKVIEKEVADLITEACHP